MGKTQSVTSCWLKSIYWCDQSIVLIGHRHCVKKIMYRSSYIYRVGQPIGHHCTVGGSYTGLSLTGQCPVGTSVCKKIIPPSLFHYQPLWTSKRRWSSKKRKNASRNFFLNCLPYSPAGVLSWKVNSKKQIGCDLMSGSISACLKEQPEEEGSEGFFGFKYAIWAFKNVRGLKLK